MIQVGFWKRSLHFLLEQPQRPSHELDMTTSIYNSFCDRLLNRYRPWMNNSNFVFEWWNGDHFWILNKFKMFYFKRQNNSIDKNQTAVTAEKCNVFSISHKCFLHCFCFSSSISAKNWTAYWAFETYLQTFFIEKRCFNFALFIFYLYPGSLWKTISLVVHSVTDSSF